MTKTQLSVRIAPETLTAIDAEARRLGVSRGHVVDRWLAEQAAAMSAGQPLEEQAWYRAGALVAKAQGSIDRACNAGPMTTWQHGVIAALGYMVDAIDVLAGTAPEEE